MHGDPAPPGGFRRPVAALGQLPPLLVCWAAQGPGVFAGGGPTTALALSGPGGARALGSPDLMHVPMRPSRDPCWVYRLAPQQSPGPRIPWEAVGVYKGGSRHHSPGLGLGSWARLSPLPLGTVTLPAPGLLQALKGEPGRAGGCWQVPGGPCGPGSSPRWPTLLLSTTRLSRERGQPWLWAEGLKDSAQLVKPVRGARSSVHPRSSVARAPAGCRRTPCGLGRQWWHTLSARGRREPRALGSSPATGSPAPRSPP